MKKNVISLVFLLLLGGCGKIIPVETIEEGYEVDKIADIPKEADEKIVEAIECGESLVCFYMQDADHHLEINIDTYQMNEMSDEMFQKRMYPELNDPLIEKTDKGIKKINVVELNDKEKITHIYETKMFIDHDAEDYLIDAVIIYENENEKKVLYEYEKTEESYPFPHEGSITLGEDGDYYLSCLKDRNYITYKIVSGGHLVEVYRFPLEIDNLKLEGYFIYPNMKDYILIYNNEKQKRIYHNEKFVDLNLNENIYKINDEWAIIQEENEIKKIVKTSLYNMLSCKRYECSKVLNGTIFVTYNDQFVFYPKDNIYNGETNDMQVGHLENQKIILNDVPFNTDDYGHLQLENGDLILYSKDRKKRKIEIYRYQLISNEVKD